MTTDTFLRNEKSTEELPEMAEPEMMAESDNRGSDSDNKSGSGGEIIPAAVSAATYNAYPKTLIYVEQLKEGVLMRDASIKTLKEVVLACEAIIKTRDATITSLKTEIEELKQTNKRIKYKYGELTKKASAVTGGGSSIGQDEHGQKRKATSSDDDQKRRAENNDDDDDDEQGTDDNDGNKEHSDQEEDTRKRKVAGTQTLPPDATAAFGNGNGKGRGKGRQFKVSTTDAGHTPGMRYVLFTWIEPTADIPCGKWDRGGQWFLHKKKSEWKFMGRKSSITLMKKQKTSGEWQVL